MSIIDDGTGSGNQAKVDVNKRLHTQSVTEREAEHSAEAGDAYNINTGDVALSAPTALIYFKNNENQDIVVEAIAVGIRGGGTHNASNSATVTVVKNATTGTLISGATDVPMNENRNFGSSKVLTGLAYVGASGETQTNGADVAQFYMSPGSRLFASVGFIIPKGASIVVEVDPDLSSGSVEVYAAIVCFLKDPASL